MSNIDGTILPGAPQKIVDHGPDSQRFNIVILGDGYQHSELPKYFLDVQNFVNFMQSTAPYGDLWDAINVHRIDVESTESGADDPTTNPPTSVRTYYDSTFDPTITRLLKLDGVSDQRAQGDARARVQKVDMTMVIVNSVKYGGSGGIVATFSTPPPPSINPALIALHEMGHTAFHFADEYQYLLGCGIDVSPAQDHYDVARLGRPQERNVTIDVPTAANPTPIKWTGLLTSAADPLPTTRNADPTMCDMQGNPKGADYVGAYEGAKYYHSDCYRPSFDCRMRNLVDANSQPVPFCPVCQSLIRHDMLHNIPLRTFLDTWNIEAVVNGPVQPSQFTVSRLTRITAISVYKWNNGQGEPGGTISLQNAGGALIGTWAVSTTSGQGGAPNVNWEAQPNVDIPAGTYIVDVSTRGTWSQNQASGGAGFTRVEGR